MKDGIIFDIKDHVGRGLGRYPESLMKFGNDLAEKKFVPGSGSGLGVGLGVGVFSKFKEWSKPFKSGFIEADRSFDQPKNMQPMPSAAQPYPFVWSPLTQC